MISCLYSFILAFVLSVNSLPISPALAHDAATSPVTDEFAQPSLSAPINRGTHVSNSCASLFRKLRMLVVP